MSRLLKTQIDIVVDIDWYLSAYPDARNAILAGKYRDALDHYLTVGIRDGRLPTEPDVDEMWYRRRYPDVAKAIANGIIDSAKQHYARWGYREGRFAKGDHPAAMEVSSPSIASAFPAAAASAK
jgi:hypothetical protein